MFNINFLNKKIKKNKILNKLIFFKTVDSTNDFLKEKNYPTGTTILAVVQLSGKGKLGKKWISDKGGLWFSFIINKKEKSPYLYVVLSSVALVEVLKKYNVNAKIKWPNDILVNNKKICGILVENDYYKGKIITGIGVNINNKIPLNTDIPAISLKKIKNRNIDINSFFLNFIKIVDKYLFKIKKYKNIIIKKWIKNQYNLKDKEIKIFKNGKLMRFKFLKLSKNGDLIVKNEQGKKQKIKTEIFFI